MSETLQTLRAAWPMLKRALWSGQLFRPQCRLVEPDPDIQCDLDVKIPMREGYALTANVFSSKARSARGEAAPVIMCAHPYDNHKTPAQGNTPLGGPPQQYRLIPQAGETPRFSTLTSWESPDPNFWVAAGYTLVNLNLPGYANSGGPPTVISSHQGARYREAIEWVGAQPWCDGGVGLCGVSYLAISQYHAAAAGPDGAPKALKCICPWEGLSDIYRDLACGGGVADSGFLDFWWHTEVKEPLNDREAFLAREETIPPEILNAHPLFDAYWADKAPRLTEITTPMLVCGSFSDHELHTTGSFRAFTQAQSEKKWLYTHRTGKWASFYSEEATALIRDFMDHFLKDVPNRFADLPPVRLEVRSDRQTVREVRWEAAWPLPATEFRALRLRPGALSMEPVESAEEVAYDAARGVARFDFVFDEETELSGPMALRLFLETRGAQKDDAPSDDAALCVYVDKLDTAGRSVRFNGSVGVTDDMVTRGYLRASRRALDEAASTEWSPVLRGDVEQRLQPGEIARLDIALRPSSTHFAAGEGLRLIVAGHEIVQAPIFKKDVRDNRGRHVLHMGGSHDARLLAPWIGSKTRRN